MIYLFADLSKDLIILLVVSIAFGAAFSLIGGRAAYNYFGQTVAGIMGDYGEHDLVLTVNEGSQSQIKEKLKELFKNKFKGASYKESITVAGKANIFVSLGDNKNEEDFLAFLRELHSLNGLSSYNIMSEPRLSIRALPQEAVGIVEEALKDQEGIDFTMYSSRSLEIFLKDPSYLREITAKLDKLMEDYKIMSLALQGIYGEELSELSEFLEEELEDDGIVLEHISFELEENSSLLEDKIKQLEDLLASYLTSIQLDSVYVPEGTRLYLVDKENSSVDFDTSLKAIPLQVFRSNQAGSRAFILEGDLNGFTNYAIYSEGEEGNLGDYLGQGELVNIGLDLGFSGDNLKAMEEDLAKLKEQLIVSQKRGEDLLFSSSEEFLELVSVFLRLLEAWEDFWLDLDFLEAASESWPKHLAKLEKILAYRHLFIASDSSLAEKLRKIEEDISSWQMLLGEQEGALAIRLGNLDKIGLWKEQLLDIESLLEDNEEFVSSDYLSNSLTSLLADLEGQLTNSLGLLSIVEQDSLLAAEGEEIKEILLLLQDLGLGQATNGEELTMLVTADNEDESLRQKVKEILGPGYPPVQFKELGVFRPDIRGEVFRLLGEVRLTLTALFALVLTIALLILDHTLAMSLCRLLRQQKKTSLLVKILSHEGTYGFLVGSLTLWAMVSLSGGQIPYLNGQALFLIGGILGLLVSRIAPKVNPITMEEFTAGEALGMDLSSIVREIVLPAARPGVFSLLNRCNQLFF